MITLTTLSIWAVGAVAAYALDRDPRADRRERMQWAAMWPLAVLIGLTLGAAALAGIIWRSVAYRA